MVARLCFVESVARVIDPNGMVVPLMTHDTLIGLVNAIFAEIIPV